MARGYPVKDTRCGDGALRTLFLLTSMPIGGAETLLVNLVRRLDKRKFAPEIACLKSPGELGDLMSQELPVHSQLIRHKLDLGVLFRLQPVLLLHLLF